MSNEEMAKRIQEGETEYCLPLWNQIKLLLYKHLHLFKLKYQSRIDSYGLTDEDIMQEFYFAMLNSVKAFDGEKEYKFTTYLKYHTFNCFYSLIGVRRKTDALNKCVSYDNTITDNAESGTFLELIEDKTAEAEYRKIEDSICNAEIKAILEDAIQNNLTPVEAERVKQYFYNNISMQKIAEKQSVSNSAVDFSIIKGLEKLRNSEELKQIKNYCDFDLYNGNGLKAFKNRGCSTVEYITEARNKGLNAPICFN